MKKKSVLVALALLALLSVAATSAAVMAGSARSEPRPETRLVVYSFRAPGVCPACDAARPVTAKLAREFPISFVYRDDPDGPALCADARVDRFPTFVMTQLAPDAPPKEIFRWSGANNLEARIRAAFRGRDRAAPGWR